MTRSVTALALALTATLLTAGCADEATPPADAAGLSERYPDDTAADWVASADHVVVATVVAEREVPQDEDPAESGETTVPREVSLHLDEVVWSAEEPARGAPEGRFPLVARGWTLDEGEKVPVVAEGTPRLEVGHSYVLALFWEPAVPDGPEPVPAHWNTLGLDSVVPFDGGVIGAGEVAGTLVSPSAAPGGVGSDDGAATLGEELAGQNLDALRTMLDEAAPDVREDG
ncbi:hypothetical protein MWU57_03415 [Isoptericola sp. S6320L]|uniref:hypothetical protein n=1 Tax=Isoptericola sp. S6320L TaxID=2926411 RepID=UPI001FF51C45|nr:hypothetical protein [Isoptericola sp. S6320L]MCK0116070.1 hypothetical protein [Isoptericola sp. S6320L]